MNGMPPWMDVMFHYVWMAVGVWLCAVILWLMFATLWVAVAFSVDSWRSHKEYRRKYGAGGA